MNGKLVVDSVSEEEVDGYVRIGWRFRRRTGLCLGNIQCKDDDTAFAIKTIRERPSVHPIDLTAVEWHWRTLDKALRALRTANAAARRVRAEAERSAWPEWARTARANGWRAPKGWKP